ncbi:MAG TPA: bifunctional riboflavin kinase/FAD synthetase [Terriglobia bacterium]|nr:bifunctional riboflavin kinase/FAD synthetase [Terriglobia bacterium]
MQVYRSLQQIASACGTSTVTVGAFDGIHRAHQELLRRVRERARSRGAYSVAVTFDPHPAMVLAPEKAPRLLTPLALKLERMESGGLDRVLILPFTLEFSRWTPERFVQEVIVQALCAESVFVGENFRFGHRQAGNPQVLEELGRRFGFQTVVLEKMLVRKTVVSSSQIRGLLEQGNVVLANRLLGYPFTVRGPVVPGLGIGRRQTVPTLNLGETGGLLPQPGVYITVARPGGGTVIPAVSNVGTRPTFGERGLGVETHLLESWPGPPPAVMEVGFLRRLRAERKFDSAEQLKEQILQDVRRAQRYFHRLRRAGIPLRW